MATARRAMSPIILELDPEEAGYLYDLLYSRIAGPLNQDDHPIGRIREALKPHVTPISFYCEEQPLNLYYDEKKSLNG